MTKAVLRFYRNPFRQLFSVSLLRACGYLLSYVFVGTALFAAAATVLLVGLVANVTWLGIPLLTGAGYFQRGCASVERWRARLVGGTADPRPLDIPAGTPMFTRLREVWTDPVTVRSAGFLIVLYPVLLLLDLVVAAVFVAWCGMVVLPLWYWAIPAPGVLLGFPDGGFYVSSLPAAAGVALVALVLAAATAYPVVGAARLHRTVVRRALGPYRDPLAEARAVLISPGPLARSADRNS